MPVGNSHRSARSGNLKFERCPARAAIALLGLALVGAVAVPQRATQKKPVLGLVAESNADSERLAIFRERLKELGYIEDQNITIEFRLADQPSDYSRLMAALVAEPVDIVIAGNAAAALAAHKATRTIPIVMAAVNDPLGLGVVSSLDHPGSNITGTTNFAPQLIGDRLKILNQVVPGLSKVSMILNGANPNNAAQFQRLKSAVEALGIEAQALIVRTSEDIPGAFSSAHAFGTKGLFEAVDNFINSQRFTIAKLASQDHLPVIYSDREYVLAGGLMSLGPGHLEAYRLAAEYVDKILRGANPGDLPVAGPTQVSFSVSRTALTDLGLTLPQGVSVRVNEWLP